MNFTSFKKLTVVGAATTALLVVNLGYAQEAEKDFLSRIAIVTIPADDHESAEEAIRPLLMELEVLKEKLGGNHPRIQAIRERINISNQHLKQVDDRREPDRDRGREPHGDRERHHEEAEHREGQEHGEMRRRAEHEERRDREVAERENREREHHDPHGEHSEAHERIRALHEAAERLARVGLGDMAHELRMQAERIEREIDQRQHHGDGGDRAVRELMENIEQLRREVRELHEKMDQILRAMQRGPAVISRFPPNQRPPAVHQPGNRPNEAEKESPNQERRAPGSRSESKPPVPRTDRPRKTDSAANLPI